MGENAGDMKKYSVKSKVALGVVALIVLAAIIAGVLMFSKPSIDTSYDITPELTEELRSKYEQDLATEKALIESQKNKDRDWLAYTRAAWAAEGLGRYGEAQMYYQVFLKKFPEHRLALTNYANIMFRTGRYKEAEVIYAKVFDTARLEEDFRDYVEAVKAQNTDGSRSDDLIALFEQIVRDNGQTPYAMEELARAHEAAGRCELALEHYAILRDLVTDKDQKRLVDEDIARVQDECIAAPEQQ